jgi:membrane protease YdiL (CAAX protease family)
MQPLTALLAKKFFPAFIFHVQSRLPFDLKTGLLTLVPLLAISLLGEELFYRVLIQGRLSNYLKTSFAILASSLLFAFAHFSPGPVLVVALDLSLIFIDSILYGIMYSRKNNIIIVWLAHLIGDVLGLVVILSI